MTVELIEGPIWGDASRDAEGHRTYEVTHLVLCDSTGDGPAMALECPGLPQEGDYWQFGNDEDVWAWCTPEASVKTEREKGNTLFKVRQKFTTKPVDQSKQRCNDVGIEDPLLEPAKISGQSVKYTEEAYYDRFGFPVVNSAHEQIRGPQNEWDRNRSSVKIEQNVLTQFQADTLPSMLMDCVNAFPLWGYMPRCVKLSEHNFERVFFGRCEVYFKRSLTFDRNNRTFDRNLLDEGTKVLNGRWDNVTGDWVLVDIPGQGHPQWWNPQHFIQATDRKGNPMRVILNGHGLPAGVRVRGQRVVPTFSNQYEPIGDYGNWYTQPGRVAQFHVINIVPGGHGDALVETTSNHGLTTGTRVFIADYAGAHPEDWNGSWTITVTGARAFTLNGAQPAQFAGAIGGSYYVEGGIDHVLYGAPIRITSAGHGLSTGHGITIENSFPDLDGDWIVTKVDDNVFSLDGSSSVSTAGTGTISVYESTVPGQRHVEKYDEVDLLTLLGLPVAWL